jgi:hypothetical protein
MNIEKRVDKLEGRLGVNQTQKSIDEMLEAFSRGEYGRSTMMSIVVGAMNAKNPKDLEEFYDSLRQELPLPLIEWFKENIRHLDDFVKACENDEEPPHIDQRVFNAVLDTIDGTSLGLSLERGNLKSEVQL